MAHHPIGSLLSPPDPAVSMGLSPSSNIKYDQSGDEIKSLVRDNSPLKSSLSFKHVMDAAALFKYVDASPPRGSPLCQPCRSPLFPIVNVSPVERQNTKSPLRNLQSRSLLID